MDAGELDFFLRGNTSLAKVQSEKPVEWISEKGWKDLLLLTGRFNGLNLKFCSNPNLHMCRAALKVDFGKLPSEIVADAANWKAWNDSEAPEAREFPAACNGLNLFQRMCVVKCFRADRYTIHLNSDLIHQLAMVQNFFGEKQAA